MAGKQVNFEVNVDASDGIRGLKDFSKAAQKAGKDAAKGLEDTASAGDKARTAIKQMATAFDSELREAAAASDALKASLGEMADRVDVDQVVADLNRMGVTFDEIRLEADQFATTLKEIDGIRVQQVNDGLDNTRTKLQGVRDSGDQSRSVLANLAGNAAQDLGELGGVVGSLGVGIGQLAEYAVDGNIALSNLAKVAGPLAGISLGLAAINKFIGERKRIESWRTEQVEGYADAVEKVGVGLEAVKERLGEVADEAFEAESGMSDFLIGGDRIPNVAAAAGVLGLGFTQVAEAIAAGASSSAEGEAALDALEQQMIDAGFASGTYGTLLEFLAEQQDAYAQSTKDAAAEARFFRPTLEDMNAALRSNATTVADTEVNWRNLLRDLEDGTIEANDGALAWRDLQQQLGLSNEEMAEMVRQKLDEQLEADAEAADALGEAIVDTAGKMRDAAAAIGEIRDAAADVDLGGALQDALDASDVGVDLQVAEANIRTNLTELFDSIQTFIDEHGAVDWSVVLDPTKSAEGFDTELAGMIVDIRDTFQEGIVNAFESGGAPAAQAFVSAFLPQLLAQGMTPAQAYELLGLPADGSVQALIQVEVDKAAAARAVDILDAIAGTGTHDPRVAALQIALNQDQIPGELAETAGLLLASELGIPVNLEELDPADIAAVQGFLDNQTVMLPVEPDDKPFKEGINKARHQAEQLPVTLKADADTADADKELAATAAGDKAKGGAGRVAPITAQALVDVANLILGLVARPRTAPIIADLRNEENVERDLERLARDRFADIFVRPRGVAQASSAVSSVPGVSATAAPIATGVSAQPQTLPSGGGGVAMLTAPTPVTNVANVTINAGVLGNHFDVERTVARALRRHQRVNGRR